MIIEKDQHSVHLLFGDTNVSIVTVYLPETKQTIIRVECDGKRTDMSLTEFNYIVQAIQNQTNRENN